MSDRVFPCKEPGCDGTVVYTEILTHGTNLTRPAGYGGREAVLERAPAKKKADPLSDGIYLECSNGHTHKYYP